MEVTKTKVNSREISSEIDLDLPSDLTTKASNETKDNIGEFLIDTILERVGRAQSPVTGDKFKPLSKDYKKLKKAEGRGTKANLEFSGEMLDDLKFERTSKGVKLLIKGENAPQADGHNNFSGRSTLPTRQFLPKEGQTFMSKINKEVNAMVNEATVKARKIRPRDLSNIGTKSALNAFLSDEFVDMSVREAKSAILIDDDLRELFAGLLVLF